LLDRDFWADFEMRDIGKKKHCDLIEFAGRCARGNRKAQNFFSRSRLQGELAGLARKQRCASERERRFARHSRVREHNGEGDRSGNVIPIFDCHLDFPVGREANRCIESLNRFHGEGEKVVGPNVDSERTAVRQMRAGAGALVGRLEVPVGSVEVNHERLCGSRGEWRNVCWLWLRSDSW